MMQAFREAQEYIDGIPKFVKKNTMEDTKAFYRRLSCPCEDTKVIHVAGTNGKGSVCAYLQSVLTEAGYRTGLFTSPHLVDIRERIRVDGEMISEEDFAEVFAQVRDACGGKCICQADACGRKCICQAKDIGCGGSGEKRSPDGGNEEKGVCYGSSAEKAGGVVLGYEAEETCMMERVEAVQDGGREALCAGYHPSYFEYLYFMAMLYFEKRKPDIIILETGLGGRLDATNSFPSPCISIITGIGLDHTEYLGETLEEIAAEKAGIVKKGIPLVYFANNKRVSDVIEKSVKKAESGAFSVKPEELRLKNYDEKGIDFSYYSGYYKYSTFHLFTKALYQQGNAALCVKALAVLSERGVVEVSAEDIRRGLERARWEGRMQEILPDVWLDGAHNPDGIRAFLESVRADGACGGNTAVTAEEVQPGGTCGMDAAVSQGSQADTGRILLYSALAEKACAEMAGQIAEAGLFEEIVVTRIENPRAAEPGELAALFGENRVTVIEDIEEALGYCLRKKAAKKKVYIAGSLYLAGQVMALSGADRGI